MRVIAATHGPVAVATALQPATSALHATAPLHIEHLGPPVKPQQADIQLILRGVADLRRLDSGRVGWSPGAYAPELAAPAATKPSSRPSPRSKQAKPRDGTSRCPRAQLPANLVFFLDFSVLNFSFELKKMD